MIHTFKLLALSKEVSSTFFKVFGITQSRIEPQSTGPYANNK